MARSRGISKAKVTDRLDSRSRIAEACARATAELEYDWGRTLRVSVIRGAVPADLMRIEADDQCGRGMCLEIPLSALRSLHETLDRAGRAVAAD